jgi:hypothetical protein
VRYCVNLKFADGRPLTALSSGNREWVHDRLCRRDGAGVNQLLIDNEVLGVAFNIIFGWRRVPMI